MTVTSNRVVVYTGDSNQTFVIDASCTYHEFMGIGSLTPATPATPATGPVTVQECAALLERLEAHSGEADSHALDGAMAVNASWNRRHNTEQMNLFVIVETELKLNFRQYKSVLNMQEEPAS